jgi:hypoxanthine-DNA glycosylase
MIYSNPTIAEKRGLLPLADHKSRVLILDVMPCEKSKILQQYYPNKSNNFWKILNLIYREPKQIDYKLRKQMLLRNGIALWNVLETEDTYEQPNDFQTFFRSYRTISRIIFNGNNAAECYGRHVGFLPNITHTVLPSTSSLNTWKSFEEKAMLWKQEILKRDVA